MSRRKKPKPLSFLADDSGTIDCESIDDGRVLVLWRIQPTGALVRIKELKQLKRFLEKHIAWAEAREWKK